AARDIEAFAHHLPPDLPRAVDLEVLHEGALDLRLELQVPLRPCRQLLGAAACAPSNRSLPLSTDRQSSGKNGQPRDPTPTAPHARAPQGKTCLSFCSS